jgi:hypothetical protein
MHSDIEQSILSKDPASYHKLVSHLISVKDKVAYISPGVVAGKNVSRPGGPDTFFLLSDGNYASLECTIEKFSTHSKFMKKLKDDIDHSFNELVTTIEKKKISKCYLAFCHRSPTPREIKELETCVKKHNPTCQLILLSLEFLTTELTQYPGIINTHLGIIFDSGQIFNFNDFLEGKENRIQPGLNNEFKFRANEIERIDKTFQAENIILLTGVPGVGKTKLACQYLEKFQAITSDNHVLVISGVQGISLRNDLIKFVLPNKKYIILFDDANRTSTGVAELISFISSRPSQFLKVLITVRDYAIDKVETELKYQSIKFQPLPISPFTDKEIKEIADSVLEKGKSFKADVQSIIAGIAKGNARLAIMTGQVVKNNEGLSGLLNVATVFENYFNPILSELTILKDKSVFNVLAIISFLGSIDKKDSLVHNRIFEAFAITPQTFWEKIEILKQNELLDVYENEVAKVADQVMASYAFYTVFIKSESRSLPFLQLIRFFITTHHSRIQETILDSDNTFINNVRENIINDLTNFRSEIETDSSKLFTFYKTFWFYQEINTLEFLNQEIQLAHKVEGALVFTSLPNSQLSIRIPILDLLKRFWVQHSPYLKYSLELARDYALKVSTATPYLVHLLHTHFEFNHSDSRIGYERHKVLIDVLSDNKDFYFSNNVFLEISSNWFKKFHTSFSSFGNKPQVVISNFSLPPTDSYKEFRKLVLRKAIQLFHFNEDKALVLLLRYVYPGEKFDYTLWVDELPILDKFFKQYFKKPKYQHASFVYRLIIELKKHKIKYPKTWDKIYSTKEFNLVQLFNIPEEEAYVEDVNKVVEAKAKEVYKVFKGNSFKDHKNAFDLIEQIIKTRRIPNPHWLSSTVTSYLILICQKDKKLFLKLLEYVLENKNGLEINTGMLTFYVCKNETKLIPEFYQIIGKHQFRNKFHAKVTFFVNLPDNLLNSYSLKLIELFSSEDRDKHIYSFESLHKYAPYFEAIKKKLPKAKKSNNLIVFMARLSLEKKNCIRLGPRIIIDSFEFFENDLDLAGDLYIKTKLSENNFDFNCEILKSLVIKNEYFIVDFLKSCSTDSHGFSINTDHLKLGFLWELKNYKSVVNKVLEIFISQELMFSNWEYKANVLFKNIDQKGKALDFIKSYILSNPRNEKRLKVAMNIISYSFPQNMIEYFIYLLKVNTSINLIRSFSFSNVSIYTGSRIPYIISEIETFKNIITAITCLGNIGKYKDHLKYFNDRILGMQAEIKEIEREEFVRPY